MFRAMRYQFNFQEPSFKAYFDLTIVRPSNIAGSISNTKLNSTSCYADRCIDVFETTPKVRKKNFTR